MNFSALLAIDLNAVLHFQLYCWIFSIATIERWLDSKAYLTVISTFLVVAKLFAVIDNAEGSH